MVWTVYSVPHGHRTELEAALRDDLVSRQSQTVRDAAAMEGPADALYVLVEGSAEGVRRAEELLGPVGTKVAGEAGERLRGRFQEERDAASSGMGLFFTEG